MRSVPFRSPRLTRGLGLCLCLVLPFGLGCSSSDDSESLFTLSATSMAAAGGTPMSLSGVFLAYLADEATTAGGAMLNSDTDVIDSVVQFVDLNSKAETNVGVAAREIAWLDNNLYLVVDEGADEVDWDGDGAANTGELSLLHWTPPSQTTTFIASLEATSGASSLTVINGRLFFSAEDSGAPGSGMTSLRFVKAVNPFMPKVVTTSDSAAGGLRPAIVRVDEGLMFLVLDETLDGELNGDGDSVDPFVMALLDTTRADDANLDLLNTGLGVASAMTPTRALNRGMNDWLVGMLVSEDAQNAPTGFNDPALFPGTWQPLQCVTFEDTDTLDDVLFFMDFAAWVQDPMMNAPVNTGLVGQERILAVSNSSGEFVGTISSEEADGGCDLNGDGDTTPDDRIARWVQAVTPLLPPFDPDTDLIALADAADIPGGTAGFAELDGRLVILASELNDDTNYDGDVATDFNLIAWREPGSGAGWDFDHGVSSSIFGGATWMTEVEGRDRLLLAFPENIEGVNSNVPGPGAGPDMDTDDSIPSFSRIETPSGELNDRFRFLLARAAVTPNNPGMLIAEGIGFYRVLESDDSRDWNNDGDLGDAVLFRTNLSSGASVFVGVASGVNRPVVEVDHTGNDISGGGVVTQESMAGQDLNGDGDTSDFVVQFFRM